MADYKTLFLGACVLISLLGGGIWGLWTRQEADAIEQNRRVNELQWERLRTLNDEILEIRAASGTLRLESDDHEIRLRSLEGHHSNGVSAR